MYLQVGDPARGNGSRNILWFVSKVYQDNVSSLAIEHSCYKLSSCEPKKKQDVRYLTSIPKADHHQNDNVRQQPHQERRPRGSKPSSHLSRSNHPLNQLTIYPGKRHNRLRNPQSPARNLQLQHHHHLPRLLLLDLPLPPLHHPPQRLLLR